MYLGVIIMILLLAAIGLVIWLLVRQSNACPKKGKLNDTCTNTTECNSGLVCSAGSGSSATTNKTCKVAYGGVCLSGNDCALGQTCINGICSAILGTNGQACPCANGFTCVSNVCRVIIGQPCQLNSDCATGVCSNGICGVTDPTHIASTDLVPSSGNYMCDSSDRYDTSDRCDSYSKDSSSYSTDCSKASSNDSRSKNTESKDCSKYRSKVTDSWKERSHSRDTDERRNSRDCSRDSGSDSWKEKSEFYTCSDSNCSESMYPYTETESKEKDCERRKRSYSEDCERRKRSYSEDCERRDSKKDSDSWKEKSDSTEECRKRRYSTSTLNTDCTSSSGDRYVRRGVYVTNEANQDSTLFTSISQPIIDIARGSGSNFILLLKDGNLVSSSSLNTVLLTDKKMMRMVRFGTEIVAMDKKGKLYTRSSSSTNTNWNWEHLANYPCDAQFINSTNSPYNNLEVLTCTGKAYLYTFSTNWKNGIVTNNRKTYEPRYYGKDINRYIDINERTNIGKTNTGEKFKHIKAAGFYNTNSLVSVMTEDTFTHVRIIDNSAYFLFEQL